MFYKIAKSIVRFFAVIFMPYRIHNADRIPTEGPLILCANHISYTDPIFMAFCLKRNVTFIAKKEVVSAPIIGFIIRKLGAFPVDRDGKDLKAVRTCVNVLKSGGVLGIFPEGTRIIKGRVSKAKPGTALIAKKSSAPLVMIHIRPKKGHFRLFTRTDVFVSNPTDYQSFCDGLDFQEASDKILKTIYSLGEENGN